METIILNNNQFNNLLEYSGSLPTGTTIGKKWKRKIKNKDDSIEWFLGEYKSSKLPGMMDILWKKIEIKIEQPPTTEEV